ncbi:conjugal transfer protein [Candidatus Enterococcus clewellii]|uniref:Conjugative transposon membrane protein n=1 Tax=Candidatus Enterococcus clewellii TaxID=1834193 RepID=A0A242K8F4_9ENTE|nr:hypothetical protein A5888_001570 [Enterococcus sp. 9E7_DIV0242]
MQNQVKNWSKIWKIERVFYKITDEISLPRPMSQTFLIWFVIGLFLSFKMKGIFPFSFSSASLNHLGIPFLIAFIMNKKTFQGKKPYNYLLSALLYLFRSKVTRLGRKKTRNDYQAFEHEVLIRERKVIEYAEH